MHDADGFWGPPSATTDFCEPNYAHSHYIAEMYNTITSVPILLTGLAGIHLARSQKLGAAQTSSYALVALVGLGSLAFHATLLRTGQVLDEVPMLWAVVVLIHTLVSSERERRQAAATAHPPPSLPLAVRPALLRGALLAYSLAATGLYFTRGFGAFVVAYASSVVALVGLAVSTMFAPHGPSSRQAKRLLVAAALTYAGGFLLLWLPGELLCHRVPLMRRLPMHALFHLTSAAGPHLGLTAFAVARHERERAVALSSPLFCGLPAIERRAAAIDKAV